MSPPSSAWRCQPTFRSVAGPAPYRVRGVAGLGSLALSILINHTAHRCRRIPETAALYNSRHTECGGMRQDISLPRRNKSPETPGKIELSKTSSFNCGHHLNPFLQLNQIDLEYILEVLCRPCQEFFTIHLKGRETTFQICN
jgi:hypothetical protein